MGFQCCFCARSFRSFATRQRHITENHIASALMPSAGRVGIVIDVDEEDAAGEVPVFASAASGAGSSALYAGGPATAGSSAADGASGSVPRPAIAGAVVGSTNGGGGPAAAGADGEQEAVRRSRGAEEAAGQAALACLNQASSVGQVPARADCMARGSLAGQRASVRRSRHVFLTSMTARICCLYDAMPEASQAMPVVSFTLAHLPSLFSSSTLRKVLKFSLTAGGGGLSRLDRLSLAGLLRRMEGGAGGASDGDFSSTFLTNHSLVTGICREQNRVLAMLQLKEVPLDISGKIYQFVYRDLLDVGVAAVTGATNVDLDGGALPSTLDGQRRSSGTLDANVLLQEAVSIRRLHGDIAGMLSVSLHADETRVSWRGAQYMLSIRAHFLSAVGSAWVTAGCIPHISKAFIHTAAAHLAVSDARNDLVQRCLAVFMRRFIRASEFGFPVLHASSSCREWIAWSFTSRRSAHSTP